MQVTAIYKFYDQGGGQFVADVDVVLNGKAIRTPFLVPATDPDPNVAYLHEQRLSGNYPVVLYSEVSFLADQRALVPIDAAKQSARKDVNVWRATQESAGFTYAGKKWQSDALSAQRIMGAAIMAMSLPGHSQAWTASDNSVVKLDQAGIQGLFQALGVHVAATFATAQAAKASIAAAKTVTEIEAALATLN